LIDRSILRKSVVSTLFFILGFTMIFVALGAGASSLSGFLTRYMRLITIIGGGVIIILALQVMELFTIPFLNYQKGAAFSKKRKGVIGSFIIGVTFAAAWTPCIGPILSSILILAATKGTALKGVFLLAAYSVGLGLPFLFAVVAFSSFLSFSSFLKKNFKTIKLVSGILLLAIGLTLIIGQFQLLARYLSFIPDYSLIESNRVSIVIALFAGFISFISPCVLPLIPSYLTFITGVSVMEAKT
jgi:cytochrome c-type biogenesis protein